MYNLGGLTKGFSEITKLEVWQKGQRVFGYDPAQYRKDLCGAWMSFKEYGNRNSKLGWEVDHQTPVSEGGGNEISNLRPLQWENNVARQNGRLVCVVSSSGRRNANI
jgi:hypothetical protein